MDGAPGTRRDFTPDTEGADEDVRVTAGREAGATAGGRRSVLCGRSFAGHGEILLRLVERGRGRPRYSRPGGRRYTGRPALHREAGATAGGRRYSGRPALQCSPGTPGREAGATLRCFGRLVFHLSFEGAHTKSSNPRVWAPLAVLRSGVPKGYP
jgi:hypothetical protein